MNTYAHVVMQEIYSLQGEDFQERPHKVFHSLSKAKEYVARMNGDEPPEQLGRTEVYQYHLRTVPVQ